MVNETLVFQINFCFKSPALRVAANRWQSVETERTQRKYKQISNSIKKMNQAPSKTTRGIFWFWTLIFYTITIAEINQLSVRSFGEQKIFMVFSTGFLFFMYIAIYLTIMMDNFSKKYFSKFELIFFIIGILISVIFFFTIRNNANIVISN